MVKGFWQATTFLTTIPTPPQNWERGDLGRSGVYFPLVGFCLGGLLIAAWQLFTAFLPANIAAVLIVILWAALTGGLHLDGLSDCGDGLLAAVSPERRLEILKDSRIGAFGAITLILHLFLKIAAIATLNTPIALLLATTTSRWLVLPTAKRPLARPGGMGAEFSATVTAQSMIKSVVIPALLALIIGWAGLIAFALASLVAIAIWRLAQNRLGGITGDIIGLVIELTEVVILLCFTTL